MQASPRFGYRSLRSTPIQFPASASLTASGGSVAPSELPGADFQAMLGDTQFSARAIALLVDQADPMAKGHSCRVALYATAIGEELGLDPMDIEGLRVGGYLHDIGKIRLRSGLLDQAKSLTDDEYDEVKRHAELGYELISGYDWVYPVHLVARHHHERHDGSGYPFGIAGDAIPEAARIVAVADAYDAMISMRGYTYPRTFGEILDEIRGCAGTQFSPVIVDALLSRILKECSNECLPELTSIVPLEDVWLALEML